MMVRACCTIVMLFALMACSRQPSETVPDKATLAKLEASIQCDRKLAIEKAAYRARYGTEPNVYIPISTNGSGEDTCPHIYDHINIEEEAKKLRIPSNIVPDSGYFAGQAWARDNSITDASECTNPSSSFELGCQEAVDEAAAATSNQTLPEPVDEHGTCTADCENE